MTVPMTSERRLELADFRDGGFDGDGRPVSVLFISLGRLFATRNRTRQREEHREPERLRFFNAKHGAVLSRISFGRHFSPLIKPHRRRWVSEGHSQISHTWE